MLQLSLHGIIAGMEIRDLLDWGLKSTRRPSDFETLQAWVASAVILARTQLDTGSDREPLVQHFATLSSEQALRLSSSLPSPASAEIYRGLEKLRQAQNASDSDVKDIYNGLTALQTQVEATTRGRRRWSSVLTVLKVAAYAGPVVLAYFVGTYFRFYENLVWDSDAVLSPPATYTLRSGNYEIAEDYKARFLQEFSRYYFDRENAFRAQFVRGRLLLPSSIRGETPETLDATEAPTNAYVNSPDKSAVSAYLGALRLRVVFRNPGRAGPFLVSSIETTATYRAKPFDWSHVNVSTDLDLTVSSGKVTLSDEGVGPAMDVKYTISAGSSTLYTAFYPYILNHTKEEDLSSANGDFVSLQMESDESRTLRRPVYWLLHTGTPRTVTVMRPGRGLDTVTGNLLQCADGGQYEIVKGTDRLAQLTETVRGGPAKVDLVFESLRKERRTKTAAVTLPGDWVFAKGADKINEQNPCPRQTGVGGGVPGGVVGGTLGGVLGGLLDALSAPPAPPASPKGADLIKATSVVDLRGLPDGGSVGAVASPDQILSPAGFARLDLTVVNATNGEVELQFKVNGRKLRETKVELLVPDETKFEPVIDRKLRRFRDGKK